MFTNTIVYWLCAISATASTRITIMPGRIASSVTRTSAPTAKRRVDRTTSPTTNIPDEGPVTSLREAVCTLFTESYRTTNGTRKLVVNLRKIQEVCCYETTKSKKQAIQEDFDEEEFNAEVTRCILRILPIKRSETAGDRLVRFVGLFLRHATDAGMLVSNLSVRAKTLNTTFQTMQSLHKTTMSCKGRACQKHQPVA